MTTAATKKAKQARKKLGVLRERYDWRDALVAEMIGAARRIVQAGVQPTNREAERLTARAVGACFGGDVQRGVWLGQVADAVERQWQVENRMTHKARTARQQFLAATLDGPVEKDARGKKYWEDMPFRAAVAWAAVDPDMQEEHPWEAHAELLVAWRDIEQRGDWRAKSVWRRVTYRCWQEKRYNWGPWPTWMQPPQAGRKGNSLRRDKSLVADDAGHKFGRVDELRQVFEAFERIADQAEAVRLMTLATGAAPTWMRVREAEKRGPKKRERRSHATTKKRAGAGR